MSDAAPPLTPQVLSRAALTMLVQVLGDDAAAQVTALDAAPMLTPLDPSARYERLRLAWEGPRGTGQRAFTLKVLAEPTWGELLNPALPAPSEVLLVEGDLSETIGAVLDDGSVAAGRRRAGRAAWLLRTDMTGTVPLALAELDAPRVVEALALFHVLHWGAERVLIDVYPWLPRFERWVRSHLAWLRGLLPDGTPAATPYARWADGQWPHLAAALPIAWQALGEREAAPLAALLAAPDRWLEALAASPQSLLHGSWQPAHLGLLGEEVVAIEWGRVQVGPVAWDLAMHLATVEPAANEATLDRYLAQVAARVPELSEMERARLRDGIARCEVLRLLLHPPAPVAAAPAELHGWLATAAASCHAL